MPYCNWKNNTYESCYKNDETEDDLSAVLTQIETAKQEIYGYVNTLGDLETKIREFQVDKSSFLQKLVSLVEQNSKRETDINKCITLMSKLSTLTELTESYKQEELFLDQSIETKTENRNMCIVCLQKKITMLCLPCSHCSTCSDCFAQIKSKNNLCPICRSTIDSSLVIFLP